jgi:regulator of RNase E activity RraA
MHAYTTTIAERFAAISSSTLSDVLDSLGFHGVLSGIRSVAANMKVVGPAVTVKEVSGSLGTYALSDFRVGELILKTEPRHVLVIDNQGLCVSTWGFLASFSSKVKGIAGAVIDGGVRDIHQISEIGFPVFARHVVPISGKRRIRVDSINRPISIQGVGIQPEDMIVGDDTGVVVIPAKETMRVLEEAERLERLEQEYVRQIQSGASLSDLTKEHLHA